MGFGLPGQSGAFARVDAVKTPVEWAATMARIPSVEGEFVQRDQCDY